MDYMYFIRPFLTRLGEIEGITEEEITILEAKYKVILPEAYKQFMILFGRKNGYFMQGAGMTVEEISKIPQTYRDMVAFAACEKLVAIGENWYFFGKEQGCPYYFECDGHPDPKVWMMVAPDEVLDISASFSAFLKNMVDVMGKYW